MTPLRLSLVIPTFNERSNIQELLRRLDDVLGSGWEVIFVDDDSPDGTAAVVREIARRDSRVRVLHRIGRRGLSSACIEGMLATSAPTIAVMDADLQHDETRLPLMLAAIDDGADVVVASRYTQGGSTGTWDLQRAGMSQFATMLSRFVMRQAITDPMSGFFMVKRSVLDETVRGLSALGFKILLDILTTCDRPLKIVEVPYTFRSRLSGESKLDSAALWDFAMLLADKALGRYVPVRFVMFAIVGLLGVVVHMIALSTVLGMFGTSFVAAQSIATGTAMVFNYSINNVLTYRDRRLHGLRWWRGLVSFTLACTVGAIANVGVANFVFAQNNARWAVAALAGVAVGAVWNFAMTQIYTWGRPYQH